MGDTWLHTVPTSQLPNPVAKAEPRPRILSGRISLAYTQEIGPKDIEKMQDTRNKKKTPAADSESLRDPVAPSTWDPMIASQMRAMEIPMVPKRSGFLRPTRSRRKTMKKRLNTGPTML